MTALLQHLGVHKTLAYDTWGGHWGTSWALSWTRGDVASPVVVPPIIGGGYNPSQGLYPRPPDKLQISRARKRLGLEDEVARAIAEVAARQAKSLELDAQKRFEELNRELQLRGIEWQVRYLEALNAQREGLIDAEIALRLKEKLRTDEEMIVLMLLAASL